MNAGKKIHPMEVGNDETRDAEFHCKKNIVLVNNVFFTHPDSNSDYHSVPMEIESESGAVKTRSMSLLFLIFEGILKNI